MPLDAKTLGAALLPPDGKALPLHTTLCRREAPAFQQAITGSGGDEHDAGHQSLGAELTPTEPGHREPSEE